MYIRPPKTRRNTPGNAIAFDIGYIANTANQPIDIYITLLNHLGQVTHAILNAIPITEHNATAVNKTYPAVLFKATKQNGA